MAFRDIFRRPGQRKKQSDAGTYNQSQQPRPQQPNPPSLLELAGLTANETTARNPDPNVGGPPPPPALPVVGPRAINNPQGVVVRPRPGSNLQFGQSGMEVTAGGAGITTADYTPPIARPFMAPPVTAPPQQTTPPPAVSPQQYGLSEWPADGGKAMVLAESAAAEQERLGRQPMPLSNSTRQPSWQERLGRQQSASEPTRYIQAPQPKPSTRARSSAPYPTSRAAMATTWDGGRALARQQMAREGAAPQGGSRRPAASEPPISPTPLMPQMPAALPAPAASTGPDLPTANVLPLPIAGPGIPRLPQTDLSGWVGPGPSGLSVPTGTSGRPGPVDYSKMPKLTPATMDARPESLSLVNQARQRYAERRAAEAGMSERPLTDIDRAREAYIIGKATPKLTVDGPNLVEMTQRRGFMDALKSAGAGALQGLRTGGLGGAMGGALAGGVGAAISPEFGHTLRFETFERPGMERARQEQIALQQQAQQQALTAAQIRNLESQARSRTTADALALEAARRQESEFTLGPNEMRMMRDANGNFVPIAANPVMRGGSAGAGEEQSDNEQKLEQEFYKDWKEFEEIKSKAVGMGRDTIDQAKNSPDYERYMQELQGRAALLRQKYGNRVQIVEVKDPQGRSYFDVKGYTPGGIRPQLVPPGQSTPTPSRPGGSSSSVQARPLSGLSRLLQ